MGNKSIRGIIFAGIPLLFVIIFLLFLFTTPFSYTWVMHKKQNLNNDFLVKMCPNGTRLIEIQFGQSGAIGVDPNTGNIWAPEMNDIGRVNQDQIVKYDANGNLLARYQGYRTGVIAVDPNDGHVWLGLVNEKSVVKLNPQGVPVLEVAGFQSPRSIAINPADSSIWVADNGTNDQLVHLSSEGDELIKVQAEGLFSNTPHLVAVDPRSGNVWYSGSFVQTVYLRSFAGLPLAEITGFDSPVAIAVNPRDGSAWVADYSRDQSGAAVKLDSSGNVLQRIVLEKPPETIGFNAIDKSIWVGIDGAIVRMSPQGEIINNFPGFNKPHSFSFIEIPRNLLNRIEFLSNCYFRSPDQTPKRLLKETPTERALQTTPIQVSPSPVPTLTPSNTPVPTISPSPARTPELTPTPTEVPTFNLYQLSGKDNLEITSQLAYASFVNNQLDIFLISDQDQEPEHFIKSPQDDIYPAWSPDGKSLAYLRTDSYADSQSVSLDDLYLVQNLNQTNLTLDKNLSIMDFDWSPNGRYIAFSASLQDPSPSVDHSKDIFIADIFSLDVERVVEGKGAGCNQVNWSQDNWELAFTCRGGMMSIIVIANREGSVLWSTEYFPADLLEWLPSGKFIVVYDEFLELSSIEAASIPRQDNQEDFRFSRLDKQLHALGLQYKSIDAMGWNPADEDLFYLQSEDMIQIVDLNLGEVITIQGDFYKMQGQFTWGPGGEQAAFAFFDGFDAEIGLVNFRTKQFFKLTDNQVDDLMPSWKPLP